jgi:hypothetical protein
MRIFNGFITVLTSFLASVQFMQGMKKEYPALNLRQSML